MSDNRIAWALARIEAAAGRIEIALPQATAGDPALAQKYAVLQREAGQALADIDRMIEQLS